MNGFKNYIKSTNKSISEVGNGNDKGRFESSSEYKRVIAELTKAFGRPKIVVGYKTSDVIEVVYSDNDIILTSPRVSDVMRKLYSQDYEVQVSKAANGVMITVMDTNA